VPSTPGIDAAVDRSELVRDALDAARGAHAGQSRDGGDGMAYIEHPLAVAERLAEGDAPDEVLAAALLHDVVEESEMEVAELRGRFGAAVGDLVEALTEDEAIEDYGERKGEHRRRVAGAGPEALAIYAADKLTNVAMLRRAYVTRGEAVSEQLKVPLDVKLGAWEADVEMLRERAPDLPLVEELAGELEALAADRLRSVRAPSSG
jgi:(p)ppGpp synthase/HD superfamily hydrolase